MEHHVRSNRWPFTSAASRHIPSNLNPYRCAEFNEARFAARHRQTRHWYARPSKTYFIRLLPWTLSSAAEPAKTRCSQFRWRRRLDRRHTTTASLVPDCSLLAALSKRVAPLVWQDSERTHAKEP